MTKTRLAAALPVLALLAAAIVVSLMGGSAPVGEPGAVSVDDVYRRTEEELRRRGGVYHSTGALTDDLGLIAYQGTLRRWVDVRRDVAREESELGELGRFTHITTREARYARERDGRTTITSGHVWRCRGVGVAASAVLGCPGPTEQSTTELEMGSFEGRPTLVLVTTGTTSGSDQRFTFTKRMHLDPSTFLPLAMESEGTVDFGRVAHTRQRHVFTGWFISPESLPRDFFDPPSLGYLPTDPSKALDAADLPVHWLGSRFDAGPGLPEIVLSKVDGAGGPGYRYLLHYTRADDRFGPPVVTLQLWPRAAWDSVMSTSRGMNVWDDPCWKREETPVTAGTAVLILGFDTGMVRIPHPATAAPGTCPARPHDKFLAHVFAGDTVILVDAPGVFGVRGAGPSPYQTFQGIRAVAAGLRRK